MQGLSLGGNDVESLELVVRNHQKCLENILEMFQKHLGAFETKYKKLTSGALEVH